MKRTQRLLALLLVLCALLALPQGALASGKSAAKDPADTYNRLASAYDNFFAFLNDNYLYSNNEDDFELLEEWAGYIDDTISQVAVSYQQSMITDELGNDAWTNESGTDFVTKKTSSKLTYQLVGYNTYGQDPTPYLIGEETTFYRTKNVMRSSCYYIKKDGSPGELISYLDGATGKNYVYIQKIEYSERLGRAGDETPYRAIRLMLSDSKLYGSLTYLSEKQATESRIGGTYKNFETFQFKDSILFAWASGKITITPQSGKKITLTSEAKSAPTSSGKEKSV